MESPISFENLAKKAQEQGKELSYDNHPEQEAQKTREQLARLKSKSIGQAFETDEFEETRDDFSSEKTDEVEKQIQEEQKKLVNNPSTFMPRSDLN
jgi:hypothetical protein